MFSNYNEARRQYEEAESLLEHISDELRACRVLSKICGVKSSYV